MRMKCKYHQLLDLEARGRLSQSVSRGWVAVRDGSPPRRREATPLVAPVLPERPPGPPFSLYRARYPPAHLCPLPLNVFLSEALSEVKMP